jgi:hypothetical protein
MLSSGGSAFSVPEVTTLFFVLSPRMLLPKFYLDSFDCAFVLDSSKAVKYFLIM